MGQGQTPSQVLSSSEEMRDPGNEVGTRLIPVNKQTNKEEKTVPGIANRLDYPWRGSPNLATRISTPSSPFLFDSLPTALGPGK